MSSDIEIIDYRENNNKALSVIKDHVKSLSSNGDKLRPSMVRKIMQLAYDHNVNLDDSPEIQMLITVLLNEFSKRKDAYRKNTVKQLAYNWSKYSAFCIDNGLSSLPSSSENVELYIVHCSTIYHRNTISSHLWAISKMHKISGMIDPTKDEHVYLSRRAIINNKLDLGEEIKQANAFNSEDLDRFLDAYNAPETAKQFRDKALLSISYECLLRSSEIVNIRFKDLNIKKGSDGNINIPISKSNKVGNFDIRYISDQTVLFLFDYFEYCGIDYNSFVSDVYKRELFIFVPCKKNGAPSQTGSLTGTKKMCRTSINNLFKHAAKLLGSDFSAHSARVGATQDMFKANISLPLIQQAGGWGSPNMPIRYGSQINVKESGMAKMRKKNRR